MKYLFIAGACLLGIIVLSLRDKGLTTIAQIQKEVVPDALENSNEVELNIDPKWREYWYAGHAEISGYELKQSRYGEIHEGEAAMIFVTEPFSRKKQVKLDNPGAAGDDNVSVLKLNATRNFLTGIYPYSMMTSVFSPVNTKEFESAVKLTLSGQEWCGQVFMQLNNRGGNYDVKSYSYFESEGDQNFSIDDVYLEDELFNLIRLDPDLLPKGEVMIIPSAVASRFMHEELKPYKSMVRMEKGEWNGKELLQYSINYEHNNRLVKIAFQPEFPYIIEGWEDTYQGFGNEQLTTVAVRKNTKMLDYWNKHDNEDRHLNAELFK